MIKDNEQRIKDKIDFFMKNFIKVHVEKFDKSFLNGFLVKKINEKVYSFNDDKEGEIYLFLKDIYDIDKFKIKKEVIIKK